MSKANRKSKNQNHTNLIYFLTQTFNLFLHPEFQKVFSCYFWIFIIIIKAQEQSKTKFEIGQQQKYPTVRF